MFQSLSGVKNAFNNLAFGSIRHVWVLRSTVDEVRYTLLEVDKAEELGYSSTPFQEPGAPP